MIDFLQKFAPASYVFGAMLVVLVMLGLVNVWLACILRRLKRRPESF